ncbi:helix-turn-helix domain-containing protein [Lichenifustis flavocetrariae]|uniref:Helix-turn-helix domain-containing protein n=1 Tax=Lichenifustis flavocetrariae TaxID=2949735 RepID=A0AA41YXU5_9HYPH|nr:helix-turn-helix domain-containing protein [Lichenifustis flavocetrariae]MCW6506893.1 helix-turn-helix domain-containing protein [Lichenifustis flavocetrariae]
MAQVSDTRIVEALDTMQTGLDLLRAALNAAAPEPSDKLVTIKHAARVLGVSERTVRRRASDGAGVMVGGVWRIAIEALVRRRPVAPHR